MTTKHKSSLICIVLITAIVCSLFVQPVSAVEKNNSKFSKIDNTLLDKLDKMSTTDKIAVSVWFQDINQDDLKKEVKDEIKTKINSGKLSSNITIGGTGILIVIGVCLETYKQIESQLVERTYKKGRRRK